MKVSITDYDPEWLRKFEKHREQIRQALGDRALSIEHVGSSAVSGFPAKPVVDILLVVTKSASEDSYAPALLNLGYQLHLREPDWHEHRLFKPETLDVNVHVFSRGSSDVERMLTFRDRLREDAGDRELYLRKKRELAEKDWPRVQDYADAKSAVVEEILTRA